jgi:hypothetical protein
MGSVFQNRNRSYSTPIAGNSNAGDSIGRPARCRPGEDERASERADVRSCIFLSLGGFAPLPCRALPLSRSFILRKAAGRGSCIA